MSREPWGATRFQLAAVTSVHATFLGRKGKEPPEAKHKLCRQEKTIQVKFCTQLLPRSPSGLARCCLEVSEGRICPLCVGYWKDIETNCEIVSQPLEENRVSRNGQHGFVRNKSWQTH